MCGVVGVKASALVGACAGLLLLNGCGGATAEPPPKVSVDIAARSTAPAASAKPTSVEPGEPSATADREQQLEQLRQLSSPPTDRPDLLWKDEQQPPARSGKPKARRHALMRRLDAPVEDPAADVPQTCADPEVRACHPPADFVARLCQGTHPGVALVMFRAGTPWPRAFLIAQTKAWPTVPTGTEEDRLEQDEEVIVLQAGDGDGAGIQVSSGASFYALRWDGSCVKLTQEEVKSDPPYAPRIAQVEWSWLDDNLQAALRRDPKIDASYKARRKQCKGARLGTRSAACAKADTQLIRLVEAYVRDGRPLPTPQHLP